MTDFLSTRPIGSSAIGYDITPSIAAPLRGRLATNILQPNNAVDTPPFPYVDVTWIAAQLANLTAEDYMMNRAYYDGDHWQDGKGWRGPMPPRGDNDYRRVFELIHSSFVSSNAIGEVVKRKTDAALGREPGWSLNVIRPLQPSEMPSAEEQALIDEATAALKTWWTDRSVHQMLQRVCVTVLLGGRAPVRLYVPSGFVDDNGQVLVDTNSPDALAEALEAIFVHDPEPWQAGVLVNRDTMQQLGVYLHKEITGIQTAEIVFVERDGANGASGGDNATAVTRIVEIHAPTESEEKDIELQYRPVAISPQSNQGSLYAANLTPDPDFDLSDATALKIDGHMTIYEVIMPKMITEQIRRLQQAMNKVLTMMDNNTESAGFMERTITNAQMPGHYENVTVNGAQVTRFVRDDFQTGAGSVNFINGLPVLDPDTGKLLQLTDPKVIYRQPVDPKSFLDTFDGYYARLLSGCQQLHYLAAAGSQYASGDARIQSRAEFEDNLKEVKTAFDSLLTWLLETALKLGATFAGTPGKFDELRVSSDVRLTPGPPTLQQVKGVIELWIAGLMSRQTSMLKSGLVNDPVAEAALIALEVAQGIFPPTVGAAVAGPAADKGTTRGEGNNTEVTNPAFGGGGPTGSGTSPGTTAGTSLGTFSQVGASVPGGQGASPGKGRN